jgi:hypothetical protein
VRGAQQGHSYGDSSRWVQRIFGKSLNEIVRLAETNPPSLSSLISDQQRDLVVSAENETGKTIGQVLDVVNAVDSSVRWCIIAGNWYAIDVHPKRVAER